MTKTRVGVLSAIIVAVVAVIAALILPRASDDGQDPPASQASAATPKSLSAAARKRVYFAHQSVGANVISGIPAVYADAGVTGPEVVESTAAPADSEGFFAHSFIGQNGDPAGKIRDFEATIRAGLGDAVDVALLKLCYVDITSGTDAAALAGQYQQMIDRLSADYPEVTFLATTVPLTTQPSGIKASVKSLLGRGSTSTPDNVVREQYNQLIRKNFGATGRLFDIAALQSTAPDGSRAGGTSDGQAYSALYSGYASDEGHLNEAGAQLAAAELMSLIAAQGA